MFSGFHTLKSFSKTRLTFHRVVRKIADKLWGHGVITFSMFLEWSLLLALVFSMSSHEPSTIPQTISLVVNKTFRHLDLKRHLFHDTFNAISIILFFYFSILLGCLVTMCFVLRYLFASTSVGPITSSHLRCQVIAEDYRCFFSVLQTTGNFARSFSHNCLRQR